MTDYAELLRELRDRDDRPFMAAAADAIEALQKRVALADAMHDVAVRERNYERAIVERLQAECDRLRAELAAALAEYHKKVPA